MENENDLLEIRVASLAKRKENFIKQVLSKDNEFLLVLEQVANPQEIITMVVGKSEASELAVAIEELKTARPLPSELTKAIITELGYNLSKVVIDDLLEGIFYSKMVLVKENETKVIDCRPADSITQALRFKCKLFISKTVLEKCKL